MPATTSCYLPDRDGRIAELDDRSTTTSELLQAHLPTAHVVKTLSSIFFVFLGRLSRPHDANDRSALPIAGDDTAAKKTVAEFLDAIGYDALDVGPLSEGWRFQPGTPACAEPYDADGTYEHPRSVTTERLTSLLEQAEH